MFCLDTNVVIFAINGRRPQIAERLDREIAAGRPMLVPAIVLFGSNTAAPKASARSNRAARLRYSCRPVSISPPSMSRTGMRPAKSALCSNRAASRSDPTTR